MDARHELGLHLVAEVMTTPVVTIEQNEKLTRADDYMRDGRIRHLLVVDDDGSLTGVVSQRDLFHGGLWRALGYGTHARQQALDALLVKDAMRSELWSTTPSTTLRDAACLMRRKRVGCLPVLEADQIAGILTEGDFVALACPGSIPPSSRG